MCLGAVTGAHAVAHDNAQANRRHHDRHHAELEQRVHDRLLEAPAEHDHRYDGSQTEAHHQWRAQTHESQHGERGQHHELALGEVDGARSLPQQRKTQGRQRINAAGGQAAEEELKEVGHGAILFLGGRVQGGQGGHNVLLAVLHLDHEARAVQIAIVVEDRAILVRGIDEHAELRIARRLRILRPRVKIVDAGAPEQIVISAPAKNLVVIRGRRAFLAGGGVAPQPIVAGETVDRVAAAAAVDAIASRGAHQQVIARTAIEELESLVERGLLRLERAVAALGTMQAQLSLLAARGEQEANAAKLAHDISVEIQEIDAVLLALDRVHSTDVATLDIATLENSQ